MTLPTFKEWLARGRKGANRPKQKLRRASPKRSAQMAEYYKRRKFFLRANPVCQAHWIIWPESPTAERSTEIHHVRGRIGAMLLDERHWIAISRKAHWWIHQHPKEARALGLLK